MKRAAIRATGAVIAGMIGAANVMGAAGHSAHAHWSRIPAPGQDAHGLDSPAPALRLIADDRKSPATTGRAALGSLVIERPWARATPGGATVGAGYLKITNTGTAPDILIGGSIAIADRVEVHEMTSADGVMKMRRLAEGLVIGPGASVELAPGAAHLMFLGLREPLRPNAPFKATLEFKNAGAIEVEFPVRPIGAASPGGHSNH